MLDTTTRRGVRKWGEPDRWADLSVGKFYRAYRITSAGDCENDVLLAYRQSDGSISVSSPRTMITCVADYFVVGEVEF